MKPTKIITYFGVPGSGKTTKLLDTVAEFWDNNYDLDSIAYLAFSRKAAAEAKQRFSEMSGVPQKRLKNFSTLHSYTYKRLRVGVGNLMNNRRLSTFYQKSGFLPNKCNIFKYTEEDFKLLDELYRNNIKMAEARLEKYDKTRFVTYMKLYHKYKQQMGYKDYTDMIYEYVERGFTEPQIRVVIIDEAQDLTVLQWQMVFQAFKDVEYMYLGGDDSQAIYEYLGGDVERFIRFRGEQRILNQSYRLPKCLVPKVEYTHGFIQKKVPKEIIGTDKRGYYKVLPDTALHGIELPMEGTIYMLGRTQASLQKFEDYCWSHHIPYRTVDGPCVTRDDVLLYSTRHMGHKATSLDGMRIQEFVRGVDASNNWGYMDKVYIGTIHSVKGGEADHVILSNEISPQIYKVLFTKSESDSEHRVFYVGLSRARRGITILKHSGKYMYDFLDYGTVEE